MHSGEQARTSWVNIKNAAMMVVVRCGGDLSHKEACFSVQQLALGARVEQEGVAAEGEGPVQAKLVLGLVVGLPPGHIVVLHIQLLTASQGKQCAYAAPHNKNNKKKKNNNQKFAFQLMMS